MKLANPLALEGVLVRHPKLRLWVMHAGWPLADEMVGLLYAHPQVHVDVGVIVYAWPRPEFYGYLKRLVEAGFVDRVLFGSDQMIWPEGLERAIESIEEAPFLTRPSGRSSTTTPPGSSVSTTGASCLPDRPNGVRPRPTSGRVG
jgi:predicted TIM-barrel fold metal-dependent hydrolase